jgi:hypothetical protein
MSKGRRREGKAEEEDGPIPRSVRRRRRRPCGEFDKKGLDNIS